MESLAVFLVANMGNCELGQLTLTIPPFLKLTHDETSKKATFSVEDPSITRQRAMWGEFS